MDLSAESGGGSDSSETSREQEKRQRRLGLKTKRLVSSPIQRLKKLNSRWAEQENQGNHKGRPLSSLFYCFSSGFPSGSTPKELREEIPYEFLKSLIENNEFYTEDCNLHKERLQ